VCRCVCLTQADIVSMRTPESNVPLIYWLILALYIYVWVCVLFACCLAFLLVSFFFFIFLLVYFLISAGVKEGPADCVRIDEIAATMKKMKRHKAAGLSGLVAEMIQATGYIELSEYWMYRM